MVSLARFFGRTVGEGAGVAIGTATGKGVEPAVQQLSNTMQEHFRHRPLDPKDAAALEAREHIPGYGGVDLEGVDPEREAAYGGIRAIRYRKLRALARRWPGVGELLNLVQRSQGGAKYEGISLETFRDTLRRQGFTTEMIDHLYKLTVDLLSVDNIANAVQQGHIPNEGVLPDIDPTVSFPKGYEQPPAPDDDPPSHVPLTQLPISPIDESTALGWDTRRLKVLANLSGLPPGPEALLDMWNRNLIDEPSVDAGIREGHMKTKWAHAFKRMRWHVLSAPEYAGLWLRGWITKAQAIRGGALTGATPEQMDLLYKNRGRPMAPVQAFTAWARGAPHPVGEGIPGRPGTFDFQDFKRAIQQSDIRTEYVEPLWHIRWAYPSLFQLRRAVEDGGISPERALQMLHYQRYEERDAIALVNSWRAGTGATAKGLTKAELETEYMGGFIDFDEYLAALQELNYSYDAALVVANLADAKIARVARNQRIARIGAQYINHRLARDRCVGELNSLDLNQTAQERLLEDWDASRAITADAMTAAQIKKGYRAVQFTRAEAIDRLGWKGYDPPDAEKYLDQ